MIEPTKTGKDICIRVGGAIWLGGRSDLVVMEGDPDAPRGGYSAWSYIQVLDDQIPTMYEPGMVYMRDGARIHTAASVKEWLEEHDIECLDWPAYSPDLNPIEHLWSILKDHLTAEYSELLTMGAGMRFVIRANKPCIHIRVHIIHISLGELLFRADASTSTFKLVGSRSQIFFQMHALRGMSDSLAHLLKCPIFESQLSYKACRVFHYNKLYTLHNHPNRFYFAFGASNSSEI